MSPVSYPRSAMPTSVTRVRLLERAHSRPRDHARIRSAAPGFFADLDAYHFEKLHHLLRLVDFDAWRGRDVLDVGCGAGVEVVRFARGGARVDRRRPAPSAAIALTRQNLCASRASRPPWRSPTARRCRSATPRSTSSTPTASCSTRRRSPARRRVPAGAAARRARDVSGLQPASRGCNALSKVMKVPLEHEDAPVLKRYTIGEFRALLGGFSSVEVVTERFPVKSRLHKGWKGDAVQHVSSSGRSTRCRGRWSGSSAGICWRSAGSERHGRLHTLVKAHAYGNDFLLIGARPTRRESRGWPTLARAAVRSPSRRRRRRPDRRRRTRAGGRDDAALQRGRQSRRRSRATACAASRRGSRERRALMRAPTVVRSAPAPGRKRLTLLARRRGALRRFAPTWGSRRRCVRRRSTSRRGRVTAVVAARRQSAMRRARRADRRAAARDRGAAWPCIRSFPKAPTSSSRTVEAPDRVRILIWERGVGPTEASGTGRVRRGGGGRGVRRRGARVRRRSRRAARSASTGRDDGVLLTGWAELVATVDVAPAGWKSDTRRIAPATAGDCEESLRRRASRLRAAAAPRAAPSSLRNASTAGVKRSDRAAVVLPVHQCARFLQCRRRGLSGCRGGGRRRRAVSRGAGRAGQPRGRRS